LSFWARTNRQLTVGRHFVVMPQDGLTDAPRSWPMVPNIRKSKLAMTVLLAAAACHLNEPAAPVVEPSVAPRALFIAPNALELTGFWSSEIVSARMSTGVTPSVSWTTDDTTIVALSAVDERSIKLTGRRTGKATLWATAPDGSRAAATVVVTMTPPARFPIPPRTVVANGLMVEASTRADSVSRDPIDGPKGAVRYTTTATIRNVDSRERTIELDACPVWITVHGGGGWDLQDMHYLLWDEMRTSDGCAEQAKRVTLGAGSRYTLSASVLSNELLAAGLASNYRYFFHAHVRFDTTQVEVTADSAVISYPTDVVATAATVSLGSRDTTPMLNGAVTIANNGQLKSHVEYGACALRLLAFTSSDRSGAPKWNSDARRPWEGSFGYGCTSALLVRDLEPGGSLSFNFQSPLIEMMGDSLPDGRYYFSADLRFSNRPNLTVPAGSLDITLPRPPLPAERAADLMVYHAGPVTVDGSSVLHAHATATLAYANSALVAFSNDCPIVIYAYRDRARRDAAPRSGAADWVQRTTCVTQETSTAMGRGETRSLDSSVPVRDILGGSLPAGTYYFAVAIRAQRNRVFLSAGEMGLAR
jgi:hypothetical protein